MNQGVDKTAEYVSIDQMYDRFYRPDIVHARLHGDPHGILQQKDASVGVDEVLAAGLAPRVAIIDPAMDTTIDHQVIRVRAKVVDQGGGIGKVLWQVNKTTVAVENIGDRNLSTSETDAITLNQRLTLLPGENRVELIAYNRQNEIASPPTLINLKFDSQPTVIPESEGAVLKPSLHLLVVGIDHYNDENLWLKYAVQDGQAIAATVNRTGRPLFRDVKVTSLFDDQVTMNGMEQAFREVREDILPQDVFMLYLAGHGKTLEGRYYFLPHEFYYTSETAIRHNAVNQDHLQHWLAGIPALKSLVMIDTCESGSFSKSMMAMHGMAEKAAIARLRRATGRATIAASTDVQPAAEGYRGHGVFTYVLIEGLQRADVHNGNRDGYIGMAELADYVKEEVPAISLDAFNFRQLPQVHMVGADFPIGVANRTD